MFIIWWDGDHISITCILNEVMFHSGLIEFVFWGRMVKSIAHPQHTFVGVLATCCSGVQLVVKSLAPAYTLDTCFFECKVFFRRRSKTRNRPNMFFRGVRPKFHRYKLGGGMLLNYFIIINKKESLSPSPPQAPICFRWCVHHSHAYCAADAIMISVPYSSYSKYVWSSYGHLIAMCLTICWQFDDHRIIVSSYYRSIAS